MFSHFFTSLKSYIFVCIYLLITIFNVCLANGIKILPLRLDTTARGKTAQLVIGNTSDVDIGVQLNVQAWVQKSQDGLLTDVLTPTKDILFAPPVLAIPAGKTRIVRFKYRRPSDNEVEKTYRVFIQQLAGPPSDEDEESGAVSSGVDIKLRIGIPFFVAPVKRANPAPAIVAYEGEKKMITLTNQGTMHLKIERVELLGAESEAVLAEGYHAGSSMNYLLSGSSSQWIFKKPVTKDILSTLKAGNYRLRIYTDYYSGRKKGNVTANSNGVFLLDFPITEQQL
jgi:P pilus assembly chaperone PapD